MTVTRISEFRAQPGQETALCNLINQFLPAIEGSAGCVSCQLLQGQDDPTRIVAVEVWDSVESHKASLQNIPPDVMAQAMLLLAGTPQGEYFVPR
ncbi:MAG: antibiotic biosynthesis monooxygenase family protein [Planctomycetota bacterium]